MSETGLLQDRPILVLSLNIEVGSKLRRSSDVVAHLGDGYITVCQNITALLLPSLITHLDRHLLVVGERRRYVLTVKCVLIKD